MIRSSKQQEQQQEREDGATASKTNGTAVVPSDPLAGLSESERLALLIRFGAAAAGPKGGGMCAAMSHGHSFQSSIFRLPAKCSACHELVWGPFTRGCTCLTCSVTVHRSCTGAASLPRCPTKDVFDAFCRSELGLPPPPPPAPAVTGSPSASASTATGSEQGAETPGGRSPASCGGGGGGGGGATHTGGDLDEWATVDGTSAHSTSAAVGQQQQQQQQQQPSSAASCAVQDLGSSFSWSPLGLEERKRPTSPVVSERQQQEERSVAVVPAGDAAAETRTAAGDAGETVSARGNQGASGAVPTTATDLAVAADASASSTTSSMGIRGVTKLSVAGGVVGALFGGPVGAVFGLQVGAVLGAGRSVQQGLWQRIEKSRREAGAEGIRLPKGADGSAAATAAAVAAAAVEETAAREPRDLWARIAGKVESEHQPTIWELAPEQEKLLEQGECNAGEVAMFVVGKVLADETAMLFHLHAALLAEFRSRHDSSRCGGGGGGGCTRPVPIRRRSSDTDMVALFPRSSGGRRGPPAAAAGAATAAAATDDGGFFASTPGLEKTFSFVEEAEIVAGEGSDTPGSDDDDGDGRSSADDDDERSSDRRGRRLPAATRAHRWSKPVRSEAAGLASAPATAAVAVTAGRRLSVVAAASAAAVASRDSWRSNSSRMDSWVQLEGGVCGSCGGRVAGRHSANGGGGSRSTRALVGDVEEDEGGLGDGWAAAEAPVCWCRDEGGLSASPEDAPISVLANAPPPPRQNAVGDGGVAATTGADRGTKPGKTESGAGADRNGLDRPQNGCCPAAAAGATAAAASTEARGGDEDARGGDDALRDVHGVLRELTQAVLAWCPQLTSSHEAQIQAVNCIDQRVFSETYGPVFGRIASSGAARDGDASLARRVQREERSRAAAGRPPLLSTCRPEVVSALRAAGSARTGRDKLGFLVRAAERVSDALPAEQRTTDALIFSVCRHLAAATTAAVVGGGSGSGGGGSGGGGGDDDAQAAALPRPHAEVAFVEQFMRDESWVMGKQGYVLTTVIAALHVLNNPELSDDIFLDASPPPPPPPPPPVPNHEEGAGGGHGDVSFVVEDVLL